MVTGDIVTFINEPTENTPGRPDSQYACTGVVVAGKINNDFLCSILVDETKWCEVLWSSNQVTRCYKDDLKVWPSF